MRQKDMSEKILEDYNDVFADIINVLVFEGKQIVKPKELIETKLRSHYKADNTKLHEQERDVAKLWKKGEIIFTVCGIENQTEIDFDMPLRIIGYDGAAYREQLLNKQNKQRYPVMTLVLYYGKRHWKSPKSLKERIAVPEELQKYVSDYQINIFKISYLSKKQVAMFQSDYQIVADYFVQTRKGKKYQQNTKYMQHVDAMLKFLSVFTEDQDYLNVDLSRHKGGINMCVVLQEAKQSGIQEGMLEGESRFARLVSSLLSSGKIDDIKRVTEDERYRKELYRQLKIVE